MESLEGVTGRSLTVAALVNLVRSAIVGGELVPNQRLVEADPAAGYGASRGNIRAARMFRCRSTWQSSTLFAPRTRTAQPRPCVCTWKASPTSSVRHTPDSGQTAGERVLGGSSRHGHFSSRNQ